MIDLYLNHNYSLDAAAAEYGYSRKACKNALIKRGLSIRTPGESIRKYNVNETYFDKIDSEEKAYWLGFILADGNVYKNVFQISLTIKDIDHLYKLKTNLESQHNIGITKDNTKCYLIIGSQRLVQSLNKSGIQPNKTFTAIMPNIHNDLIIPFWRGMVDGDGSIHKLNDGRWGIDLTGTQNLVENFDRWIKTFISTRTKPRLHNNIYYVYYRGNRMVPKIINKLYSNANVYLDRKYDLYQQMIQEDLL